MAISRPMGIWDAHTVRKLFAMKSSGAAPTSLVLRSDPTTKLAPTPPIPDITIMPPNMIKMIPRVCCVFLSFIAERLAHARRGWKP